MHTSNSDDARAEMAAAEPALAAVPREQVAKEQQVEEPVAEQVVTTQVERGKVHGRGASSIHRKVDKTKPSALSDMSLHQQGVSRYLENARGDSNCQASSHLRIAASRTFGWCPGAYE